MKRHIALIVTVLLLLCCCARAEEVPELLDSVGVELDVEKVQRGDLSYLQLYEGEVVCETQELSFEVDGVIATIDVLYGQEVKKGDVLATLDETDLIENAESLERQLAYVQQSNALANSSMELDIRIAKAQLKGLTDEKEIESKEQEIEDLTLQLAQQKELQQVDEEALALSCESANAKLGKNQIVAPVDGRVVYIGDYEPGDYIMAYTALLCVTDETKLYISSQYISQALTGSVSDVYAMIGDKHYAITMQAADMNENIKKSLLGISLTSTFTLDDPDQDVQVGDYAAVCFVTRKVEDVLYIPYNALYSDSQGKYVYRVVDGVRIRQNVTIGRNNGTYVVITEGLEEGDEVYVKE